MDMDCSAYTGQIDEAIKKLQEAKDKDKDCTFQMGSQKVRMYAAQGSITGVKAAAQAVSVDVGVVELCISGLAYGLGIAGFEPCGFDNSLALQRMGLEGTALKALVLKNIMEMLEKKDYVSLQKAGLMDVTARGIEVNH